MEPDTSDYSCVNFDLEEDFLQFLKEARNGKTGAIRSVSFPKAETVSNKGKKTNKSWRRALFSWLRVEKKGKDQTEPAGNQNRSYAQKRGHVSGPICGGSRGTEFDGRLLRRMTSASLTGLFSPRKSVDNEARYVCLGESGYAVKNYGPVYLIYKYVLEPLEDDHTVFGSSFIRFGRLLRSKFNLAISGTPKYDAFAYQSLATATESSAFNSTPQCTISAAAAIC